MDTDTESVESAVTPEAVTRVAKLSLSLVSLLLMAVLSGAK
jgi:hypothetical protein